MSVVFHMNAEMRAQSAIKLGADGHNSGTSTPSTCEGSSQGHNGPIEDLLLERANGLEAAGATVITTTGDDQMTTKTVMGRYTMGLRKEDILGEGSFSICRKGTDLVTGNAVAIKIYKVQQGGEVNCQGVRAKFAHQVAILQHLQDDSDQFSSNGSGALLNSYGVPPRKCKHYFVRLLDYSTDANGSPGPDPSDGVMCVVTELADYSLKHYFRNQQKLGELPPHRVVRDLARAVVLATAALHAKGYVHLDLKPENMMFFNGRLKIIDVDGCVKIGTTISLQDSSSSFSPCYCAPELARLLLAGGQPEIVATPSLDAWSVGLILCECVTLGAVLRPAFMHFRKSVTSSMEAYVAFMDWLGRLETSPVPECVGKFDAELGELLSHGLLACDPQMRLTPAQCLSSEYLAAA